MYQYSWMDFFWMVEKSLFKEQRTLFGQRAWTNERLLKLLTERNIVRLEVDKEGVFKLATSDKKLDHKFINDLLWNVDWRQVEKLKVKS
jgi:hypothetical protein